MIARNLHFIYKTRDREDSSFDLSVMFHVSLFVVDYRACHARSVEMTGIFMLMVICKVFCVCVETICMFPST